MDADANNVMRCVCVWRGSEMQLFLFRIAKMCMIFIAVPYLFTYRIGVSFKHDLKYLNLSYVIKL